MTVQMPISARAFVLVLAAFCLAQIASAPTRSSAANTRGAASAQAAGEPPGMSVTEWLQRMHAGARQRNYVGTFVVSAPGGDLSSARIWHVRDGEQQIERIEALSGPQRSTFRRNQSVMTFLPEAKVVKVEKRENLDLFPNLPDKQDSSIGEFYDVRPIGKDRVAGFDADVVAWLRREAFGFVFQGYHLVPTESARENVEIPALYAGMPEAERRGRATALLRRLDMGARLDHRPNQLSGGQKQRVLLARAFTGARRSCCSTKPPAISTSGANTRSTRPLLRSRLRGLSLRTGRKRLPVPVA